MTLALATLLDFWSQFFEERVDFYKILMITEKLFPYMETLEEEWSEAVRMETYSAIKIMSLYAEYLKLIFNNETRSAVIEDYVALLSHKLEEMKEISYSKHRLI